MVIKKKAGTYDVYTLEVSFGELEAFRAGLEADHADPVRDEKLAEIAWYMDRIPRPGEDEKEMKAATEGGKPGEEGDDVPIPMPPGSEAGTPPDGGEHPTFPPDASEEVPTEETGLPEPGADGGPAGDDMGGIGDPGAEGGAPEPHGKGALMRGAKGGVPHEANMDERLPAPPRE